MVKALGAQFQFYLSELMPNMLRVLRRDSSKDCIVTKRVFVFKTLYFVLILVLLCYSIVGT